MTWTFNNELFIEPSEEHYGFVYQITNKLTGKKYIGKKVFWFKKTKTLKGKKKKYLAPSDWQQYYGSSIQLKKDIEQHGEQHFEREILILCKNKGECSYHEARLQFEMRVLFEPDLFYNDWIVCRIHRKHVLAGNPVDKK